MSEPKQQPKILLHKPKKSQRTPSGEKLGVNSASHDGVGARGVSTTSKTPPPPPPPVPKEPFWYRFRTALTTLLVLNAVLVVPPFLCTGRLYGSIDGISHFFMYGNIGVQPGFQCAAGSYGMPGANMGMACFAQPDAQNQNMAGRPGMNFGSGMPLLNAPAYENLTPKGKPKDYKEGGQAVKFDTFHGTHDKLKALLFLQQFDAAFAGGNFTEASKIRKAATFLKINALQW
ncbi:hypothetical protein L7F22_030278 [Adiantum nelumboides]|nr:hypothetical protein [Adiantum nelumboides]